MSRAPRSDRCLRFSRSGDAAVERLYRTHWTSPEIPDKRRERLAEKASSAPELVVIQPLNSSWTCCRCGGTGDLLMMENTGPACLRCVGLGDLEFLPAGDALLTRRAKAKSARHAVVVRFSRSRRRYERQGLLVEPQALAEAQARAGRRVGSPTGSHPHFRLKRAASLLSACETSNSSGSKSSPIHSSRSSRSG